MIIYEPKIENTLIMCNILNQSFEIASESIKYKSIFESIIQIYLNLFQNKLSFQGINVYIKEYLNSINYFKNILNLLKIYSNRHYDCNNIVTSLLKLIQNYIKVIYHNLIDQEYLMNQIKLFEVIEYILKIKKESKIIKAIILVQAPIIIVAFTPIILPRGPPNTIEMLLLISLALAR